MRKNILAASLLFVLSLSGAAQHKPVASQITAVSPTPGSATDLRLESFNIVWSTVKEKHFDPSFGGLDWDKVRERYAPRVAQVKSDKQLYDLLEKMLGELGQSHFHIIPPEAIVEEDDSEPQTGSVGIDLDFINGQALITRVEPDSPAARAGLRPGFVIKRIGETPVENIIKRFGDNKEAAEQARFRIARVAVAGVNGKEGTSVRISYLDERDQSKEVTLAREKMKGEMSPAFGNFPPQYTIFEAKRLEGGIGYIRFNIFVISLMPKIRAALRSMSDAPGIIIDLRGNPGGLGGMSSGIAGLMETRQTSLGRVQMRKGYQNFAVFPQKDPYTGSVAVLIDSGSASTSEIFAAGMQENGRAVIVGERSMGAVLASIIQKLPTGALFQYAIGDYKTPEGTLIEGRGVVPDVEVKPSRAEFLKGRDAQVDAALKQIRKRSNGGR